MWAGEASDAQRCVDRLATGTTIGWTAAAADWLRALLAEAAGDGKTALTLLRSATGGDMSAIPLYGAHAQVGHARIAHLMGDPAAAARSLDLATATYQRLGAAMYLRHLDEIRQSTGNARDSNSLSLSDRERDVLSLVTSGMSYKQIARDLFITQST